MIYHDIDELHIKNVQKIWFALSDFNLFDKWLKKDFNWYGLIFADDIWEISEHKLSDV